MRTTGTVVAVTAATCLAFVHLARLESNARLGPLGRLEPNNGPTLLSRGSALGQATLTSVVTATAVESTTPGTPTGEGTPSTPTGTSTVESTPTDDGTAIVDPEDTPVPAHMPLAFNRYDPKAPDPVVASAIGILRALEDAGKRACTPATHVLLKNRDEPPEALAVVYSGQPNDPLLELDLYLGSLVEIRGREWLAPAACTITGRLLAVDSVRFIEEPPR